MSEIGRFGVFLPSYIWDGDGPERARGIKEFARDGRGPRLRLALRHRPPAGGEALLLGLVPRAADGPGRRGRRHRARPPRHLDPDHAAAQPGDAGQGAGDAPVPVREPGHPGRRASAGTTSSTRRSASTSRSAASAPTRCSTSSMPLLEGETVTYHGRFYSVDDVFIEPTRRAAAGDLDRRRLAAGRPQVARPAALRRIGQGARPAHRRLDPASDLPARRHRPRLGRAAGLLPRARPRPATSASSPTRTSCTSSSPTTRSRRARSSTARSCKRDERRARTASTSRRSTCSARRTRSSPRSRHGSTPGVEYFVLHTMTPDPAQLQRLGRRDHPERHVPGARPARCGARRPSLAVTRRVALLGKPLRRRHSQVMHDAAFAAAGIDARYELLELEPEAVAGAVAAARGAGLARPRGDRAVQARRRGPVRRGRARGARRSAR